MRVIERSFSDLLRHPNDVAGDLEGGDVVLRRRGEPDLRLTLANREAERVEVFIATGRTLRNLAVHNPQVLNDALEDAFPWLEFLPDGDRREFVDEFSRVVTAAAALDSYVPISRLIREWRATAEIHADSALAERLGQPVEASGDPVALPAG